jgi:nitrate reductase gamma subunit
MSFLFELDTEHLIFWLSALIDLGAILIVVGSVAGFVGSDPTVTEFGFQQAFFSEAAFGVGRGIATIILAGIPFGISTCAYGLVKLTEFAARAKL